MLVSGTGIPDGATVSSVTSDTSFELSASTTGGSVTNGTLTFTRAKKYYNFQTNLFQATKTRLNNVSLVGGIYNGSIEFPKIPSPNKYYANQYDFYLFAEDSYGTNHAEYKEVRLSDNSIDINSSTGSNSNLLHKIIYQTPNVTITLGSGSLNETVTGTFGTQEILTSRGSSVGKTAFSFTATVTSTRTLTIKKQPANNDVYSLVTRTPVATPLDIPGEDIYPTVTAADKVVNGTVSSGTNVTMDDDFTGLWAVGDKITGNAAFDARTQANAVTVTAVNVGSNAKVFTMSEAIAIDDDETLSFSNRRNYRWSLDNITGLAAGMVQNKGVHFAVKPTIKEYLTQTTVLEGEENEYKIDNVRAPALDTLGALPTIARHSITKINTTVQPGSVTFSEQALLTFGGGANAQIISYGSPEINILTGYDVEFSDLAIALDEVSTTTTASTIGASSTSVVITNRAGIMDGISTVSGIGIDSSAVNPTVSSGAGSVTGAGTIVLSAAQELEDGITLTFPGASTIATITGNIQVNKVGNENMRLDFDLEKLLTMH